MWENIRRFDRIEVDGNVGRITQSQSRQHYNKQRRIDEVDMIDTFVSTLKEMEELSVKEAKLHCNK